MRVVLAVAMYNEIEYGPHVELQLDNALKLKCFDDIVVLDDGSTDGTWDILQMYARKNNNIHVFRNEKNSILYYKTNRHKILYEHVEKFNPTWIQLRAADVIFSDSAKDVYRSQLEVLDDAGVKLISFPYVHLWRSKYWWRTDNVWGQHANSHTQDTLWKYSKNYSWLNKHTKASFHQGTFRPSYLGFERPILIAGINSNLKKPWPITLMHLGHSTHEKKEMKFRHTMEKAIAAQKIGLAVGVPPPLDMPPVEGWLNYNGYAGFHEFTLHLEKVPQLWYDEKIEECDPPIPKSFYSVIKEYNIKRAEEYKILYENIFVNKGV